MSLLATHTFTLDGWTAGAVDDAGVEWRLTDVEGWFGRSGVGVRTARDDRPGRHGSFRGPAYRSERVITLGGVVRAPDAATLDAAADVFAALCDEGDILYTLVGTDASGIAKQCDVELNAESKFAHETDTVASWQLQLAAPDPLRYAVAQSTATCGLATTTGGLTFPLVFPLDFGVGPGGGTLVLVNEGNTATWPTWAIIGPAPNPVILNTDTGERLALAGLTIDAGQTLTLDTDARTVMLQGVASRRGALTADSTWFPLRPGATRIAFQAASYDPSANLAAAWRSAWS
ncbi:phage tail domain-containing protein [Actinomadura sp. DC4]|uniref:phage distal tail protein n=1 Tax=Actinomadura sp. DC4 TaxID=3055069 RepID=UPI0025AF34AF|nr:phage tail domain-containing protein [Actinomadura sp. DC4]MDN3356088.1 phage tail family protein [Actinomadura sp. DC4]